MRGTCSAICLILFMWGVCSSATELEQGYELLSKEDFVGAKRVALTSLRKQEHHVPAYSLLALASYGEGQTLDAITAAEAALMLDPENAHLMMLLVSCYQKLFELYDEPAWHKRAMNVAEAASWIKGPFQIPALEFIVKHEKSNPYEVVKQEPPIEVYKPIVDQINRAWVASDDALAPVDPAEVALLADPLFIDHRRVARGRLSSGQEIKFYPTYPARKNYFAVVERKLGAPTHVKQPSGSPYLYNYYGRVIIVSDAEKNVYGLVHLP